MGGQRPKAEMNLMHHMGEFQGGLEVSLGWYEIEKTALKDGSLRTECEPRGHSP